MARINRKADLLLAVMLLCGYCFCPAGLAETTGEKETVSAVPAPARVNAVPDGQWQKKAVFPDWKGYTDDTLAMNSMLDFQGRHGQGTLWITVSEGVGQFFFT